MMVAAPTMAYSWFSFVMAFALSLGGAGLPLGVPPLPEDPTLASIAPEQCLAYISSAGMAVPDAKSGNQTEQLLAEPEVQLMAADVERAIRSSLQKTLPEGQLPPGVTADALADAAKLLVTRPLAVYISDAQIGPQGPAIRGAFVVNCGDQVSKLKSLVDQLVKVVPPDRIRDIDVGGEKWKAFTTSPDVGLVCGFKGPYFIVTLGKGESQALVKRFAGAPPAWLTKLRKDLSVERLSTVTYINIKAIKTVAIPMAAPQLAVMDTLGLENVTTLSSVAGLDKNGSVAKTLLGINGGATGLLSLADAKPLTEADLAIVPRDATIAVACRISPEKVYDTILDLVEKLNPRAKEEILREGEAMKRVIGVGLRDDILSPLGDTWRLFDSPSEGSAIAGLTLVVSLKDPKQAAASNATWTDYFRKEIERQNKATESSRNMFAGFFPNTQRIDTVKFAGQKITVYSPGLFGPPFNLSWCVTDKELIVALVPQAIKAYLSRTGDFESLAKSPEVAKLFQGEGGPLKFVYADTRRVFDVIYPILIANSRQIFWSLQRAGIELDLALLPSARAIRPHLTPTMMAVRRTKAGIEVVEQRSLPGPSVIAVVPAGVATAIMPMRYSPRPVATRASSMNQMKQITLGLLTYENAQGVYPPAYTTDKNGKPLLSWRVLILPYLDQKGLYDEFHLDEPWDSPHNKTLINRMPPIYRSASSRVYSLEKTCFQTVRGKNTIFSGAKGTRIASVTDGTSNTIMMVEVPDAKAVIWTKPDDFEYDDELPIQGLVGLQPNSFLAGFADGSVRSIPSSIKSETLKDLFIQNDGKPIDSNDLVR